MKKIYSLALLLILLSATTFHANNDDIKSYIDELTNKKMEGRKAGTQGEKLASEYIASIFKKYGLTPAFGNSYFQEFEFISGVELGKNNKLKISCSEKSIIEKSFILNENYLPLAISKSAEIKNSIAFAGYGITAPELNYDDYKDLNVENKTVIVLMHYPKEKDENNPFKNIQYQNYGDIQYKIFNAANHKAAGIIFVKDLINHPGTEDELIQLKEFTVYGAASIPAIHIKRQAILPILEKCGFNLSELEKEIEQTLQPGSKIIPNIEAEIKVDLIKKKAMARNVGAITKGKSDSKIVIGAHYDHLGASEKEVGAYYPGADDNASGVAGLLYLAKRLSSKNDYDSSILFIAFSAEEIGVQGSNFFVNSGIIPINNIKAMINMDMIGRLREKNLIIGGAETADEFKLIINKFRRDLNIKFSGDGYGPSDHSVFYNKNIPVLFFFTGAHSDHHSTSDTAEKINIDGLQEIADLIYDIVNEIEKSNVKLTFHRVKDSKPLDMSRRGLKTYLGTIPDFAYDGEGVKISGVRDGSPANNAGLQEGDIIIQLGDKKISNLNDYTYALGSYSPGDKVKIKFIRNGEEKETEAILSKR